MIETGHGPAPAASGEKDLDIATELLRIVRSLAKELRPQLRHIESISLDSDLERDVGLDSLGRAELILRIDKAFKVRLPDQLLSEADNLRDLLVAIEGAGPVTADLETLPAIEPETLPEVMAPSQEETLLGVVDFHIRSHADRPHLRIWKSEGDEKQLTYGDLHEAALRLAFGLIKRGVTPGDRIAIMLPTETSFFEAFLGTLYAGGVPVPMYPPFRRSQIEDHLRRQAGILRNAGVSILVTTGDIIRLGPLLLGLAEKLRRIETVSDLKGEGALDMPYPADAQTTALIQYTSGSTGDPKGVVLTHANLLSNIRAMGDALEASSADIFVSWLPLYHDMGLIGAWLGSLYYGVLAIIMSPLTFLADPSRWLRVISHHRATLSAAPNFAFELCCKRIQDEDIVGLDLSSLRAMLNGAEPVSPATIKRFEERFSKYGFRPELMGPVYGLAENSVGLAFPPLGRKPIVDRIDRTALARDGVAVRSAPDDATAISLVACGQPLTGHEIRIIDDSGRELPERREGRLQFKGPSATSGYFRNKEKNRTLFDGEWLDSGDRAYLAAGDVYITGRVKDIIIKAGRNLYPHEIEELVGGLEDVRKGCVAAVASPDPVSGTERLILLVETRLTEKKELERLEGRIREACVDKLNMPPDVIELVPPHTVPKTSSGKIRRAAAKALYEAGIRTGAVRGFWSQLLLLAISGIGGRLRRGRRSARDLSYAAYWWTLVVVMAAVTWIAVVLSPRLGWRHKITHAAAKWFLWLTGTALKSDIAQESLNVKGILVANHASYLDGLVILAAFPGPLTFVAKEELAGQWIAGPFLRRLNTIFVHRTDVSSGVEDIRPQIESLGAGSRIVSFPEGTLTRMPGLLDFRLGPFLVAAKTGSPVVPVTIRGTRAILRGGQWFPRHGDVEVLAGRFILPDGSDFSAAVRLRDKTRAEMLEMCGEPDLRGERITIEPV